MSKRMKRVKRAVAYTYLLAKHFILSPIARFLFGRKHIWIVCERGTDARDNGYHFFRHLRENHPEQKVYYVIDRKSADYPCVAALGDVVQLDSLKHWLLFLGADVRISTHNNGGVPGDYWRYRRFISHHKGNGKVVFLQHGVTKDDMTGLYRENTNFDLFICGAKPEYEYVLSRFGYTEDEAKLTGLARFDQLQQFTIKRQVLIMPTWRDWLSLGFDGAELSERDVEHSDYVQRWSALLKNDRIRALAQKYDVQFVFYPHYEMQPFLHLFGEGNDQIVFADFVHYNVQNLLKESMLLITDYSSVFFDFAYMQKPVLYYQFDEDEYRKRHYSQGYFDYRRDGFGEVVTEETELLDLLEEYLAGDCHLKPVYQKRIDGFFSLHDDKNCERIFREIKNLT